MVFGWLLGLDKKNEQEGADKTSGESGGSSSDVEDAGGRKSGKAPSAADTPQSDKDGDGDEGGGGNDGKGKVLLSKSTRLKGYMTFTVASAINYYAANESASPSEGSLAVPATEAQSKYAMAASMTTIIIAVLCIIVHFDRFTCLRKSWVAAFKSGSKAELGILIFLLIWWLIATVINTSATGVAGPGKGQYNLYFSTWVNFWTAIWTMDRWLTAAGYSSFKTFMDSWPNRAPGWMFMCIVSIACLASVVDLFKNWETGSKDARFLSELYAQVPQAEWEFTIFVAAFTVPTAAVFSLVELFRVSKVDVENTKSDRENIFEGFTLLLLVFFWIPTVILATTPGGLASLVGNAYFFTWFSTIVVIETFVWWIRDWRKGIHDVVHMQEEEYRRAQQEALEKHKHLKGAARGGGTKVGKTDVAKG